MFHWTIHLEGERRKNQAAVVVGHQIYSFGGDTYQREGDHIEVHVFNTVSLTWRKLTPLTPGIGERHLEVPCRRLDHTAVLIESTVYLWGGYSHCNVLYAFDVNAHRWFKPQVSGTVPERRCGHSACVLGKVIFIHGGWIEGTGNTNDMYKLDTSTMVWTLINTRGTPPPVSYRHSATIIRTKMFVFGGWGGRGHYYNTIRVFDTENNLWLDTPSTQLLPAARWSHSAFTYDGEMYILGGWNDGDQYLNDMWKFSPETFSWKKVEPKGKGPSAWDEMCCCMMGDRIFLFGGYEPSKELYVLDFSPSLKTLCKLAVIQYGLDQSELTHNIRWELAAMTIATATTGNNC